MEESSPLREEESSGVVMAAALEVNPLPDPMGFQKQKYAIGLNGL